MKLFHVNMYCTCVYRREKEGLPDNPPVQEHTVYCVYDCILSRIGDWHILGTGIQCIDAHCGDYGNNGMQFQH